GDGLTDDVDLDTDGDGIPDAVECPPGETIFATSATNLNRFADPGSAAGTPGNSYAYKSTGSGNQGSLLIGFSQEIPVGSDVSVFLRAYKNPYNNDPRTADFT